MCRFGLNLGIIERPLAVGFVWALVSGDWETSLGVALFYELFWLDLFPAGTFVPPQSVASTVMALSLISYFGLSGPSEYALPLLCSLPMGLLGVRLELFQRRWQDAGYNSLLHWARKTGSRHTARHAPGRLVGISLLQLFALYFITFCLGLLALIAVMTFLQAQQTVLGAGMALQWGHLWFVGALGGVLSLRIRKSYVTFALCAAVVLALGMPL